MREHDVALFDAAAEWASRAHAAGWLFDDAAQRVHAAPRASPDDLFAPQPARPLVVALFGGTGVGKSSLLNRIAGQDIARVGPERPTSREVTIYLHESVELADLPPGLPVDKVRIHRHAGEPWRDVLWLDAPDIDSTAEENRHTALAWLPHVDLLIYVVSPERYRDDAGWRVLRERGGRHGWAFVINHWDRGHDSQRADFERLLDRAGFREPLLTCTSCAPNRQPSSADELPALQSAIRELLAAHGLAELARTGRRARLDDLDRALITAGVELGDEGSWARLTQMAADGWPATATTLSQGVDWIIRARAAQYAERPTDWIARAAAAAGPGAGRAIAALRGVADSSPAPADAGAAPSPPALVDGLWDDWFAGRFRAYLDEIEVSARHAPLGGMAMQRELDSASAAAEGAFAAGCETGVRFALARSLARWRTGLLAASRWLSRVMPAAALLWVGYAVVLGYYRATTSAGGPLRFLGAEFAIHSVLLVVVAWALPYAANRALRPSAERLLAAALRRGVAEGCESLGGLVRESMRRAAADAKRHRDELHEIRRRIREAAPLSQRSPATRRLVAQT